MYHLTKFSNHLRLLTIPMSGTHALTALALFPVGSRYEKLNQNGLSHFIEHMMFKGTERRPTTLDLSRELDAVGAEYNAYTSRDHTGYYIKIDAEKAELAMDMLSDMLWHSKFEEKEIKKEKGVIAEEINMYQDNPTMYIEQLLEETIFPHHPLGRDVAGKTKIINQVSRGDLADFYSRFYQPSQAILVLAGQINAKTKRLASKYFCQRSLKSSRTSFLPFRFPSATRSKIKVKFKETDQAHLALGFPAFSYDDPRSIPLTLLNLVVGATMSSRLFIEVREKRGLCYMIQSGINHYQETGNFVIQAGLDKTRAREAWQVILAELEKIKKDGVKSEELQRAKDNLAGRLVLACENSNFQAEWYGRQALLMKKIETPEQKLKKMSAVKKEEIQKIAREIFQIPKIALAVIGPYKDEMVFKKIIRIKL